MTFDTNNASDLQTDAPKPAALPIGDDDAGQPESDTTLADRARRLRAELASLGRQYTRMSMHIAGLLSEVQRGNYWRGDYLTFAEYVENEVGIRPRTAQELMKVFRAARKIQLPPEEVERLGWTKLAVVAGKLTEENKAKLLGDVDRLTYSQLKKQHGRGTRTSGRKGPATLCLTETIQKALRRATCFTHNEDPQHNLEYVARTFLKQCQVPSFVDRTHHPN